MKLYISTLLNLSALLSISLANGRMDIRFTHHVEGKWSFPLPKEEANAVFYLSEDKSLYIGGEDILYHFNFEIMKNYTIKADFYNCLGKPHCKNYLTFVGQLLGNLTLCGTNAQKAGCWVMNNENVHKLEDHWTELLAPRTPAMNYNILITGNQVYSTVPRKSNNAVSVMKTFRKIYGNLPLLYTGHTLWRDPEFVKSLVVEKEDKVQSKILLFFTENNIETRTVEKRLTMVAQMCKNEVGSMKADTRNIFSTALKSHIICGNQLSGQYYPHLQDIYYLQGKTGNVIYGLFKNSWNHSAVCSYEVEAIESLFNTSSLFGSSKKDLKVRPGTCHPTLTPEETSEEASRYPELTNWLWPSRNRTVFQNLNNFQKIVVDEITAVNQKTYRVFILATDFGTVHKTVELEDGVFDIPEVRPFKQKGRLQFMELKPNEHVLYMGTTREISRLPLDDCAAFYPSCKDCIQSRDPFCGWIEGKCESVLKFNSFMVQQNLKQNATCELKKESTTMYLKENRHTINNKEVKEMVEELGILSHKFMEPNTATKIRCIWLLILTIQLLILM
ncbi:semaphorin-7A isoform X2 [Rhinoderma darwinii]|uniref:semaphorin-7A isoform X2 n=1 Tax=Rhinoderma darwinii TaxID=43563 RepID=UPI003F67330F